MGVLDRFLVGRTEMVSVEMQCRGFRFGLNSFIPSFLAGFFRWIFSSLFWFLFRGFFFFMVTVVSVADVFEFVI